MPKVKITVQRVFDLKPEWYDESTTIDEMCAIERANLTNRDIFLDEYFGDLEDTTIEVVPVTE